MIKIYVSNGNGKTFAAVGAALKAAEAGDKVIFSQFFTSGEDSELKMLQKMDRIAVLLPEAVEKKFIDMNESEKLTVQRQMVEHYERLVNLVRTNCCEALVLDCILDICDYGLIDCADLVNFLKELGKKIEIVLTGERITHEVMEVMDYISDIHRINDVDTQYYVGIQETIDKIQII